jgi:DNA polymerase-1
VYKGVPFGGPSGKVLDHLLNKYGRNRQGIITTNVVSCETDEATPAAIKCCKPRLDEEIKNAELIIAGGAEAVNALTSYRAVYRARGFAISRTTGDGKKQRVIATNNPAAVMRNSDAYPDVVKDFRRAFDPPPPPVFPTVEIIDEADTARSVLRRWLDADFDSPIASDLEWAGSRIECCGFSRDGRKSVVFGSSGLIPRENQELIKRFYERDDLRFIWHNGKDDTKILHLNGIKGEVHEDTFFMSFALDERPGYHTLEYLLSDIFGWPDYEPKSVKHFKTKGEFDKSVPLNRAKYELYKYNGWDAAGTLQLYTHFLPLLEADGVVDLYRRLLEAGERFRKVELTGFHYDIEEACNLNEREVIPRLWALESELRRISGHSLLNPKSHTQLRAIYYQDFRLKHRLRDSGKKKLATSTGKEVREEIEGDRFDCAAGKRSQLKEFAGYHGRYSRIQRVGSNYLEGLIRRVQEDGKLYCRFNLGGTATGRTSSTDPNFQNITREGVEGIPGIRNLFLPPEGYHVISADYSQAELRTCAKLSGDDNLLSIYRDSSRSLHRERAAAFYGEHYTKEQYVKSKNINFGVTYGQSAKAFAQMYHMPEREAQAYIDSWWREFPRLKEWTRETARRGLKEGYVQSPFGHKRRFHLITDENIGDLQREAVNFLPQNIAAWLTITSIVRLVDLGVLVVATVHDSIVAVAPAYEANNVAFAMKDIMERTAIEELGWTDIPFLVDISVGNSWGTIEDIPVVSVESAAAVEA